MTEDKLRETMDLVLLQQVGYIFMPSRRINKNVLFLSKLQTSEQTNNKYTHKVVHLKMKTIYKIPVPT
jgi:hypothetical protein